MTNHGDQTIRDVVEGAFGRHPDKTGQLLNVLNDIQTTCRYIPPQAIELVAERMGVPAAQIERMGEFFNALSLDPVGRVVVEVCDGTACHTQGSARLIAEAQKALGIEAGQTTDDGLVTLRAVGCVGACGMAPVVVVDGEAYGRIRITHMPDIASGALERAREAQARDEKTANSHDATQPPVVACDDADGAIS